MRDQILVQERQLLILESKLWYLIIGVIASIFIFIKLDISLIRLGVLQAIYILYFLIAFVILYFIYMSNKSTVYEITESRFIVRRGWLNKYVDQVELYRIKDYELQQPLIYRLFSRGNVFLATSDRTTPEILIEKIKKSEEFLETLRHQVELTRGRTRTREID